MNVEIILHNGKIATNSKPSFVEAVSIANGRIVASGSAADMLKLQTADTQVLDLHRRTVIPGLNDSHMHLIRGGLTYNLELRWDGVPSLSDALRLLKRQAQRTSPPQWVRVVGGWSEFQFAERRLPTLQEINEAAPDTPAFILHLYDRAFLNAAALKAVGYTKNTPDPDGGEIERDKSGNPTGLVIAKPNANILYATLAKGPVLSREDQKNSTRQFMRELNRFGITSVVDAGGGFQKYPDDYEVLNELHEKGQLTVRFAYNLFTQKPRAELADYENWTESVTLGGDDFARVNGAGEMLVYSAADFEDVLQPLPHLPVVMESQLEAVVLRLSEKRWPFRLHATYNETIERALNVYERVNRTVPFGEMHWFFDHCETITDRNIERIAMLGGGIAVQNRMAFQGEYLVARYGKEQAMRTPPVRRMLDLGVPVGAGTDGTRVSSYNPFLSLHWLITGRTIGGLSLYPKENQMTREEALYLYTVGSSWFSSEETKKGALAPGQLADLAVLSADYFSVAEEEIKSLEAVLTIVSGRIVYASQEFGDLAPPDLPASPEWSPVRMHRGYQNQPAQTRQSAFDPVPRRHSDYVFGENGLWSLGCDCFAF